MAIIGVVAALTIPTVVQNYQKHQTVVALKKIYSEIVNIMNMAEVDGGIVFSGANLAKTERFYNDYFKKQLKTLKVCSPTSSECWHGIGSNVAGTGKDYCSWRAGTSSSESHISAVLANGMTLYVYAAGTAKEAGICVDLNGNKGPNRTGRDIFNFYVNGDKKSSDNKYGTFFYGGYKKNALTRDTLLNEDESGCNKRGVDNPPYNGAYCGALIQLDGWQIKDDYPW